MNSCCLLLQCKALRTCCSSFPITTKWCCDQDVKVVPGADWKKNMQSVRFVAKWRGCYCNLSVGVALNALFTTNGMRAKNNTHIYAARTSNNRVIVTHELYCCLLPQCEALHTCRSGFLIATILNTSSAGCQETCTRTGHRPTVSSWPAYDILLLHFKCQPLSARSYVFLYKVRTFRTSL